MSTYKDELLKEARHYIFDNSLHVFAIQPRGKAPVTKNGFLDATDDINAFQKQIAGFPDANIAVRTGGNHIVVDVDGNIGRDTLYRLERQFGKLPRKHVVETANGFHIHLYSIYTDVRCSAGLIGPGIDIRANGGYVILPPSIHPSGKAYKWIGEPLDRDMADAPAWLLDRLKQQRSDEATGIKGNKLSAWLKQGVKTGTRNQTMTKLIGHLFRCRVAPSLVVELAKLVNEHCFTPPLDAKEMTRIIESIAWRELRRRGN